MLEEVYAPRMGTEAFARFLTGGEEPAGAPVYARIQAARMFTFALN